MAAMDSVTDVMELAQLGGISAKPERTDTFDMSASPERLAEFSEFSTELGMSFESPLSFAPPLSFPHREAYPLVSIFDVFCAPAFLTAVWASSAVVLAYDFVI